MTKLEDELFARVTAAVKAHAAAHPCPDLLPFSLVKRVVGEVMAYLRRETVTPDSAAASLVRRQASEIASLTKQLKKIEAAHDALAERLGLFHKNGHTIHESRRGHAVHRTEECHPLPRGEDVPGATPRPPDEGGRGGPGVG